MALDEPNEEEVQTINEIEIMIDKSVEPYAKGNQIDFVNDHRGTGFVMGPKDGSESCC